MTDQARFDRSVRKHLLVAQSARLRQRMADELEASWVPFRLLSQALPFIADLIRPRSTRWQLAMLAWRWWRQRRKAAPSRP